MRAAQRTATGRDADAGPHTRQAPGARGGTTSAELKAATEQDHIMAEGQPFVQRLMSGELTVTDYTAMVSSHLEVYRVLENAVAEARTHPWCAELFDPKLDRTQRLATDLDELCAAYGIDRPQPGPATARYIDRIRAAAGDPVRLIAHHYIRYLGDLSGGQAIAAKVRRHTTDKGLNFYDFADVHPIPHYKGRYRATLDTLPLTDADFDALVDEVRLAFRLNADVFADLMAEPVA